ncbi:MAG: hypothetical protein HDR87_05995 [Bacteroides sp.]|nr:hypothetical protein [Bacteroides sp.]
MKKSNYIPLLMTGSLLMAACASIGRPEGGPRDVEPPVFTHSSPAPGAKNVKSKIINLSFNENIQLSDPGTKVAISPAQTQQPSISANGRNIRIELKDSLIPNTTYTIDFTDAISDLNEGNPMDGFSYAFSTGDNIDSLMISGMVLQASNLEPAQGMLVGVYATDADSAITSLRFDRITRTNQYGQFSVRNLAPGTYQLFAVNDVNRDYHWDRSEDIAFFGEPITPSASRKVLTDTLKNQGGMDSIVSREVTEFLPNDLLLSWFNENYKPQYLKDYNRTDRRVIALEMNGPVDSLPELTIVGIGSQAVNRPLMESAILSRSVKGDTLQYWLTDTALVAADSLLIRTTYRRVDSLENIVWHTDTLKFNVKGSRGKKAAPAKKPQTLQEKIDSILAISDTIPIDTFRLMQPSVFLNINASTTTQDVNRPFLFSIERPYESINLDGIRLEMMPDTLWLPVEGAPHPVDADSTWRKNFKLDFNWTPGMRYRLTVDSMAVNDPYGVYNRTSEMEFKVRDLEEYSNVLFNITGLPDGEQAYVEILSTSDLPVAKAPVNGSQANVRFLLPATYYARLFIDSDGNGEYTEGSLTEQRQPEEVYYFSKKLALKKNWDRTETWDLQLLPVDAQKPDDIKKNKPKPKPGEEPEQTTDDDEEEDEFIGNFGQNNNNKNRNRNSLRR